MKNYRVNVLAASLLALSLTGISQANAANKPGGTCSNLNQIVKIGSSKYECLINKKSQKKVWAKIVIPAGFSCVKSKKALPMLKDSFASISDYMEIVKATFNPEDDFYKKTEAGFNDAQKSMKTLTDAINRYC